MDDIQSANTADSNNPWVGQNAGEPDNQTGIRLYVGVQVRLQHSTLRTCACLIQKHSLIPWGVCILVTRMHTSHNYMIVSTYIAIAHLPHTWKQSKTQSWPHMYHTCTWYMFTHTLGSL